MIWKVAREHYPEYLMEAAGLCVFMISAGMFGVLLESERSLLRQSLPDPMLRRLIMGVAMGCTAVAIIYSPWGKQSGAHINPAVTLTFLRLGKIVPADALFYIIAQVLGGIVGVEIVYWICGMAFAAPPVEFVQTVPGTSGNGVAFVAELAISSVLMFTVLIFSNSARLSRYTGVAAGLLVASFITYEAPLSGMSMNPARTIASAFPARFAGTLWIYFVAPVLGMLLAAQLYLSLLKGHRVLCAKLQHDGTTRCIFRCRYSECSQ